MVLQVWARARSGAANQRKSTSERVGVDGNNDARRCQELAHALSVATRFLDDPVNLLVLKDSASLLTVLANQLERRGTLRAAAPQRLVQNEQLDRLREDLPSCGRLSIPRGSMVPCFLLLDEACP